MSLHTLRSLSRLLALPVIVAALISAPVAGSASPTPSPLDKKAAKIVDTAPVGEPLEVVVTSRDADGTPVISTIAADTKSKARAIVAQALGRSRTIGAEMNHLVSIDAYNDTYRSQQWALTSLKAETVHGYTRGSGVTVAVIDTGVKSSHSDLSGRVLTGIDYVAPGTSANDENGHGTHVAGIITAKYNNSRGIAGMAPSAKVLPVRVLDRNGSGTSANVAKGILYAATRAKVINLSLGSTQSSTAMQTAVAEAISKNVLVVAAAGNRGCGLFGSPHRVPGGLPGRGRCRRRQPVDPESVVLQLRLLGRRRGPRAEHHLDDDPELRGSRLLGQCQLLHDLRDVVLGPVRRGGRRSGHRSKRVEPVDGRQPAAVHGHRRLAVRPGHQHRRRVHQPVEAHHVLTSLRAA